MFDILTDVWAHPGAAHAPIIPFDITELSADSADAAVSNIHKYGIDTLMLTCKDGKMPSDGTLEAVFAAASKRFMLIFVHESVLAAVTACSDENFRAYNPMLMSHRLVLKSAGDSNDGPFDETVAEVYLKFEDEKLVDAVMETDCTEGYEKYRFVQTANESGIDLLCPETSEMLVFGAYETFLADYKEAAKGTLVGIVCDRLSAYNMDEIFWSYEMLSDFLRVGGNAKMLASLFMSSDKRSEKEGARLYRKALSARLESSFCRKASDWCGANSLAFAGKVPYRFASNCGRRFTVPVWSHDCFTDRCESENDIISGVRFLADVARGEGFTGAGYSALSINADSLMRELHVAFAGSAALVFLPAEFADPDHLDKCGIRREDMRKICNYIKRMSTLGTSCGSKTNCAVLCDDELIPYSGAEKLRELGVDFNFISKDQIMERGSSQHGELLLDKFRYYSLLIDQRIRLEPSEVMKIGEFASFGGKMYRGGAFGDFAKKNGLVTEFGKECASSLIKYETVKCTCPHLMLVNRSDSPVNLNIPFDTNRAGYYFDAVTGKTSPLNLVDDGEEKYTRVRILQNSTAVFAWDPDNSPEANTDSEALKEVYALKLGDNKIDFRKTDTSKCVIEADSITGNYVDVFVSEKEVGRVLSVPYSLDITKYMKEEECTVKLCSDGNVKGAVLRITDLAE